MALSKRKLKKILLYYHKLKTWKSYLIINNNMYLNDNMVKDEN